MSTTDIHTAEWLEDSAIRAAYGAATHKYDIALALVTARTKSNLTQAALADLAGVSLAYLGRVERGDANPTIGRLGAIFAAMGWKCVIQIAPLLPEQAGLVTPLPTPPSAGPPREKK
jgi:DNA-binding XRE family transcriptional regulator